MEQYSISVIIPVYNVENYIAKCLDSVLQQCNDTVEIICVNDDSPDGSRKVIADYLTKYKNIKCINRPNGGLSAARNTGIKHAKGEYILFLDSDDFLAENVIGKMYKQIETERLDMLLGNIQWVYENDKIVKEKQITQVLGTVQFGEDCFNTLIETDYYVPMAYNAMCRRDFLIENNLYFREGYVYEDEMWMPEALLKAKRVNGFKEYHYNYFQRENTITSSKPSEYKLNCLLFAARFLIELSENLNINTKANLWVRSFIIWGLYSKNKKNKNINVVDARFSVLSLLRAKLPRLQFERCLQNCVYSKFWRRFCRLIYKLNFS